MGSVVKITQESVGANHVITCHKGGLIMLQRYSKFWQGKTVMAISKGIP